MRYFSLYEKETKEQLVNRYPKFIQHIYHNTETIHDYYDNMLSPLLVRKATMLLDAGCGEKGIMNKYKGMCKLAVGIDLSLEALKKNTALDKYLISDIIKLPFKDDSFDIILCQWVAEHMESPDSTLKEFYRILKKGGHLIMVTNSIYHPIMFLSSILPRKLRDWMKEKFFPAEIKEDTFPTYYKCNTLKKLDKYNLTSGGRRINFAYAGDISIFLFSKPIFLLSLIYEKITNYKWLRHFKMHIIVDYIKDPMRFG
jgi:ubiquinone/menaquinone biosynthesis C-methylase UbiE